VPIIAAGIVLMAMLATLTWCATLILPRSSVSFVRWCRRLLIMEKLACLVGLLAFVFVFGFWLTSPPFPTGRRFVAVSLNGAPIVSGIAGVKLPTLEVWHGPFTFTFRAAGTGHCNYWGGQLKLISPGLIRWEGIFQTAMACAASDLETKYLRALLQTSLWRIEKGTLILYNGKDTLRFFLAPA
jgi:heat shock protein HslJ